MRVPSLVLAWVLYAAVAAGLLPLEMPPYQNADEVNHFLRAEQISRFHLVGVRFGGGMNSGGPVDPGIVASAAPFETLKYRLDRRLSPGMFARAGPIQWGDAPVETGFANTSLYPPYFYAPSVAAIWIGKAAGLPVIRTLYLARLLTSLVSGALIGVALLLCARAGLHHSALWIFALGTLPMSLALQAACSQDGLMLGAAAIATALLARIQTGAGRRGEFAGLCLCLALVAAARPPYLALAAIPLATPVTPRSRVLGAASIAAGTIGWMGVAALYAAIDTTANHDANIGAQLHLLMNPVWGVRVAFGTLRTYGSSYLAGFIGWLGWLDVPLPQPFITVASALLAVIGLAGLGQKRFRWPSLVLAVAVLLCSAAIFLVQYLTWTAVGGPVVEGVQGRYFLPLAMLLGAAFAVERPLGRVYSTLAALLVLFPALAIGVTIRALVLRYYLAG